MPPAGRALDRRRQATSQASIGRQAQSGRSTLQRGASGPPSSPAAPPRRLRPNETRRSVRMPPRQGPSPRRSEASSHRERWSSAPRPDSRSARPVSALVWPGQDAPMTFRATRNAQWARSDLSLPVAPVQRCPPRRGGHPPSSPTRLTPAIAFASFMDTVPYAPSGHLFDPPFPGDTRLAG